MEEKKCNCNEPWNSDYWCCPPKCPVHDKTIESPKQSEIAWVKASDRLPGYETPVKWRDGNDHTHTTERKIPLIHMAKPFLTGWEWYDESGTAAPISQDAHEKEVMMQAFDKVRQIFEGRQWIMEGRGSYPYNDDRYKEEVRYMYDEFDKVCKDTWGNIQSKSIDYRKAIIAKYVNYRLEGTAAGREEVDPQEIWDEFSEYIDNDIDSCQNVAGSTIMTEASFKKAFTKFKQQKEK